MIYKLSSSEKLRLKTSINTALSIPFIAGVEGYVWESIFHYVKGLPLPDPHTEKRSKKLFDAVDHKTHIGWSLKAVQKTPKANMQFELVIQRADIIKKHEELGFPTLSLTSSPEELGRAVLQHWNKKIEKDMRQQQVTKARIAILLKSRNHRQYAFLEQDLRLYEPREFVWSWTNLSYNGLQARYKNTNTIALRWYPNQKQLFEVFTLSPHCFFFEASYKAYIPVDLIALLSV